MAAPFRAVKSVFNRKSDLPSSEAAAAPPLEAPSGCQVAVAEITSQEREQYDRDDEKQDLYRHAGDIVQDVVLLGTPIGIDVFFLLYSPSLSMLLTDPGLGESSSSGRWSIDQWIL